MTCPQPSSPFSAGSALLRDRELTAEEAKDFQRRRRRALIGLATTAMGVPIMVFAMIWGASQPEIYVHSRAFPSGTRMTEATYLGAWKHGPYAEFHRNGHIKVNGQFRYDLEEGFFSTYFSNGLKQSEGAYDGGRFHGLWRHWRSDGSMEREVHFKLGVRHGRWSHFHRAGRLANEQFYEAGFLSGVSQQWSESGKPIHRVTYVRGLRHGPASYFHVNGKIASSGDFVNDRQVGVWHIHDQQGNLESVVDFGPPPPQVLAQMHLSAAIIQPD